VETTPNYRNLFGTIERVVDRSGLWKTDFTHIKAGSFLRANGGYLIFNALEALVEPGVWPALKRTLKNQVMEVQTFDPFYLFGIHGALLSGRIAAMAIRDPDGAEAEFKRINRFFISALLQRRFFERNPLRHHIFNLLLRVPRLTCGLSRFATTGIPGYVQGHLPRRPMVSSIRRTQ
jgi:hypothetical protein